MYLSQQHDLLSSMPSGCSRATSYVAQSVGTSHLPPIKTRSPVLQCQQPEVLPSAPLHASTNYSPSSWHKPQASDALGFHERPRHHPPMQFRYTSADSSPRSRLSFEGVSKSRMFRSQQVQKIWDNLEVGTCDTKPALPYTDLIKLCILKRREGKLTLSQLYRDLEEKFPYFAASIKGTGWKNTLRHNLSTQPYFVKLDRDHTQPGKGFYWAYCPDLEKPSSLAQSSIVQLSTLWGPPRISAASVPPREELARQYCSAVDFQPLTSPSPSPEPLKVESTRQAVLPQYAANKLQSQHRGDSRFDAYHRANNRYRPQATQISPTTTLYPLRRLSSPGRARPHSSNTDTSSTATLGPIRTRSRPRSATIDTSSLLPPLSSLWLEEDNSDSNSDFDSSPTNTTTAKTKTQSLADYYLANPIVPLATRARY